MVPVGLKQLPQVVQRALVVLVVALAFALVFAVALARTAYAQDLEKPLFVVALEKLDATGYARTVMVALPVGDRHVGFILNRPSRLKMPDLFPDHAPSRAVLDPVYVGGPVASDTLFAVVRSNVQHGRNAIAIAKGVWLETEAVAIDTVIESAPNSARYYAGLVVWPPGKLSEEIRSGQVSVRAIEPATLFLPDTSKLYDELAPKARGRQVEA